MVAYVLIALSVLLRLVPHPANFAPAGAIAVFAGRRLSRTAALLVTIGSAVMVDVALGAMHGYPMLTMATPLVYLGFGAQLGLGRYWRRMRFGATAAAGVGTLAFFGLSNLGVWLSGYYGFDAGSLLTCYAAALPFLWRSLLATLLWVWVLELAHGWLADAQSKRSGQRNTKGPLATSRQETANAPRP